MPSGVEGLYRGFGMAVIGQTNDDRLDGVNGERLLDCVQGVRRTVALGGLSSEGRIAIDNRNEACQRRL
jgi:hypothetical protein